MLILVTGATGKVGRHLIATLLDRPRFSQARVRALCHNRVLDPTERLGIIRGSIADRAVAEAAIAGVSHVVHLATCKETPEDAMDVAVAGGPGAGVAGQRFPLRLNFDHDPASTRYTPVRRCDEYHTRALPSRERSTTSGFTRHRRGDSHRVSANG